MPDNPILPPDYELSDEDILSDLYRQYHSAVYLIKVYEGLLELSKVTGAKPGAGVTWEAVWAMRRLQASTYRMISVLRALGGGTIPQDGAPESAPELDLDQYKGGNTAQSANAPQKPSQPPADPFGGFGQFDLFGDDK